MAMEFNDDPFGMGTGTRRRPRIDGASTGVSTTAIPIPTGTAVPRGTPAPGPTPAPPYEEGGITGGGTPMPVPAQKYAIGAYDPAKYNNPDYHSGKYDYYRIAEKYDPTKGVTDDMLKELNALGYADFSRGSSPQRMRLTNVRGGGIREHDFEGDFITSWAKGTNPNAKWHWDAWSDPSPTAAFDDMASLFSQPEQQQTGGLLSAEMIAELFKSLQPPPQTTPVYAPPMMVPSLPEQEQPLVMDSAPSLLTGMGASPEVNQALQVIAMKYPQLMATGSPQDPNSLLAQIMRVIGGR